MKKTSRVLVLLSLFLVTAPLIAQPKPFGRKLRDTAKQWHQMLQKADNALKAKDWKEAQKITDTLLEEMLARLEGGEGAALFLARATALRALAEAGLGEENLAAWSFGMALALAPEISTVDLSPYHEAGHLLEQSRPKDGEEPAGSLPAPAQEEPEMGEPSTRASAIRPPERLQDPPPDYPVSKRRAGDRGKIEVKMVIDEKGFLRNPRLLGEPDPLFAYSALNSLRSWRFKPATLDGKPVATAYSITFDFYTTNTSPR
jgi:TonB family protein